MSFDILFIIAFVCGFYFGYKKGIINTIFNILGILIGLLLVTKFNESMTLYLGQHTKMNAAFLPILSIFVLIVCTALFFKLMSWASEQLLKSFSLSNVNRIIGGALFATLATFLFSTLVWYADKAGYVESETKEKSLSYAYIQPLSPLFTNAVGAAVPVFKGMYQNMSHTMDSVQIKKEVKSE